LLAVLQIEILAKLSRTLQLAFTQKTGTVISTGWVGFHQWWHP